MSAKGAAFTFPLEPIARHQLALAIQREEVKRHGVDWRSCVRRKAGSTKASAIFLDACNPPGCFKRVTFHSDKCLRWLSDPPQEEPGTWHGQLWSRAKAKTINGFLPFLKITLFIFDYVKDTFLFLYLFSKLAFIRSLFIKYVIIFHGLTIVTSGVLMGLAIQFDNAVVKLDNFAFPNFVWLMRILIFVATPIVPVVIILRALNLTTEKRRLEAEWKRKQESICKLYLRHCRLGKEKRGVMKALADMKMVEVTTEGVPQLYSLIVLTIFSSDPNNNCVGLWEEDDHVTIIFVVLSLIQTYVTMILSTIASVNIRKKGQLDVKSKIVLGLSVSCQLMAKLWIMLFVAVAFSLDTSFSRDSLTMTSVVVLLVLPIQIGWIFTIFLQAQLKSDSQLSTKEKLIYLLSTTWFALPVRRIDEHDQRHKGRDIFCALLLTGLNHVGTSIALAITAGANGALVVLYVMLPSLFLHLAGCGWLLLYKRMVHPWRHLGEERKSQCWGKLKGTRKGIQTEPNFWDQVLV